MFAPIRNAENRKPIMEFLTGFITVISLVFIFGGCQAVTQEASKEAVSHTWGNAPDFTLPRIDGKKLKLSNFKDKVIILDFWATSCPPCRKGIPDFIKLYDKYKNDGLVIIGISLDRTVEGVRIFCQKMNVNYPIVMGNSKVVQDYGGIRYIPTTFIIGREGNIVKKYIGLTSLDVFEKEIKQLLR